MSFVRTPALADAHLRVRMSGTSSAATGPRPLPRPTRRCARTASAMSRTPAAATAAAICRPGTLRSGTGSSRPSATRIRATTCSPSTTTLFCVRTSGSPSCGCAEGLKEAARLQTTTAGPGSRTSRFSTRTTSKIVILSRFVVLPVSLTLKVSLFQAQGSLAPLRTKALHVRRGEV